MEQKKTLKEIRSLVVKEDAPVNCIGGGAIAAYDPILSPKVMRRKKKRDNK